MIVLSTQLDDWGETSANMAIELTEYFWSITISTGRKSICTVFLAAVKQARSSWANALSCSAPI